MTALADHNDYRRDDRPRYDDRGPRYGDRDPRFEDRGPRFDHRVPRRETHVHLGTIWAGQNLDRDVIEVRGSTRFTGIVFRVDRGDAIVEDIKVTFDNDQSYSPATRHFFREGDRSCRIDLPGFDRDIKRVRFLYRSACREPVVIQVFGVL
jgi:hypothetical protein